MKTYLVKFSSARELWITAPDPRAAYNLATCLAGRENHHIVGVHERHTAAAPAGATRHGLIDIERGEPRHDEHQHVTLL